MIFGIIKTLFIKIFKKIFFILIAIFLAAIFFVAYFYFTLNKVDVDRDLKFGVTFIPRRAAELGLDWKETYLAILDDLGTRRLRLGAYWNIIEKEEGIYDFSELDWLVGEAEKRGAKIILTIGMRVPGWPECHEPSWVQNQKSKIKNQKLTDYVEAVVGHYKNSSAIWAWQAENEPFLNFGECPEISKEFLKNEINLIRSLDSRPVIVTESGEFGKWSRVAPFGDILGTTLYRRVYHKKFGYIDYHLPPSFYRLKSLLVKKWTRPENIIVVELQGEPWVADPPISDASLDEQYITMNPEFFRNTLDYIRRTDFSEFYFWGAEWWYWMKQNGRPEIWDIAKNIFVK